MKFQDFDCIKDDDWSLSKPVFKTPKGGNLVVIGHSKINGVKNHVVKCDLCATDPELNGDGLFYMSKAHLLKGKIPCLCSKAAQVSPEAMLVILQRLLDKQELTLLSDVYCMKIKVTTDLEVVCYHGHRYKTNINKLKQGSGCQQCGMIELNKNNVKMDNESRIKEFTATGKFKLGCEFIPTEELSVHGNSIWKYKCPKCSNDEYVKEGLCSGIFLSNQSNLTQGRQPCRCSSFAWTKQQREYQIKKRMRSISADYSFSGWLGEYIGVQSIFKFNCDKHGISEVNLHNFLNHKTACPQCQGKTQTLTYINTVYDGDVPVAIKFGIANDVERRLKSQNSRNKLKMVNSLIYKFQDVSSCKSSERFCKKNLACGIVAKADLFDGSSETTSINNLEQVKDIFINFGGVLVTS